MSDFLAYFMPLLFVTLAMVAFGTLSPALAAVVLVVFGEMFLPQASSFDLSILSEIARIRSSISACWLAPPSLLAPCFSEGGPGTSVEVPALRLMAFFVPFSSGRALLRDGRDPRILMRVLMVGTLIYSALCLVQIRLFPQFRYWVHTTDTGAPRTVPDGHWMIQIGNCGLVGLLRAFGIVVLAVFLTGARHGARNRRRARGEPNRGAGRMRRASAGPPSSSTVRLRAAAIQRSLAT